MIYLVIHINQIKFNRLNLAKHTIPKNPGVRHGQMIPQLGIDLPQKIHG